MSIDAFEELEMDVETAPDPQIKITESSPTTKLERRRLIEEIFEEKRLRQELADYDIY